MNFKTDFSNFKSDFFLSQIFFSESDFQIFKSVLFCETEINRGKLKIVFQKRHRKGFSKKYQFNTFLTLAKVTFLFYNLKGRTRATGRDFDRKGLTYDNIKSRQIRTYFLW